jgi:hypothetical protein
VRNRSRESRSATCAQGLGGSAGKLRHAKKGDAVICETNFAKLVWVYWLTFSCSSFSGI